MDYRHTLRIKDLNCYKCADKIKNEVLKIDNVSGINIDILNQKINLELKNDPTPDKTIDDIKKLCIEIEPEMSFIDNTSNEQTNTKNKSKFITFSIGIILLILSFLMEEYIAIEFVICFISYLLIGGPVLRKSITNLKKGIIFDENTLMSIATIGAFIIGEFQEAVAVMVFSRVGEYIQDRAINNSRNSISKLMDIRPDTANLETNNCIKVVDPNQVKIGDIIIVKPGEKIPLDGEVVFGESSLDTKALTGEFLPKDVKVGDHVLSGCINTSSIIKIRVTSEFHNSTISRILDLVENASSRKSNTENFITKFSKVYTPVVVLIALIIAITPPLLFTGENFSTWVYRALIFLVISCPCALVISIPLSFFSGIGVSSKNGILVKGSNYLEALNNVSTIVFDKTGTLTEGKFSISKIYPKNCSQDELMEIAAFAESLSNHPIAKSIVNYYNKEIDKSQILEYEEIHGHGIKIYLKDSVILSGNKKLMDKFKISIDQFDDIGTKVYVAKDNIYIGQIVVSDQLKSTSKQTISELKSLGVSRLVMLTGDNNKIAQSINDTLGLTEFHSDLLPNQKAEHVENLINSKPKKSTLLFVGDGINDAPSLAISDVGISMGGIGSDAAIEASDIVLIDDDPYKLIKAIKIAKQTRSTAIQNIIIALTVKILVIILSALGLSSMWAAILSDVGVSIVVILNSVKILNKSI